LSNSTNNTIEVFNSAGQGSVFASTGLSGPAGLAFSGGNLYLANDSNNTIEKFNSCGIGTTFATVGSSANVLEGLAFDKSGNLYASSIGVTIEPSSVSAIVKITPSGVESNFVSGSGLNQPEGLAFDSNGNLYVANSGNSTIETFSASGSGSVFASSGLYARWISPSRFPSRRHGPWWRWVPARFSAVVDGVAARRNPPRNLKPQDSHIL